MDNHREEFVPMKEKGLSAEEDMDRYSPKIVSVGDTFQLADRIFRIRKITDKDIICRPLDWQQGDDVRTNRSIDPNE